MISYIVAVAMTGLIYCLLALGLNLQWGHTGLINFGHVAFFALGAYTSALLTLHGLPIAVGIIAGGVVAGLLAYPIGLITVRLKEDYLAIVTLAFAEIVQMLLENLTNLTGGPNGLPGVPTMFGQLSAYRGTAQDLLVLLIVIVAIWLLRRLSRSPYGLVLWSIRENEEATETLGKNTTIYKAMSLVIGSAMAGIAGALYVHYISYVVPDQFAPMVTFYVWMGIILGGNSHLGAMLGTFVLMALMDSTQFLTDLNTSLDGTDLSYIRLIVVGLGIIVLLRLRPQGLMPIKNCPLRSNKGQEGSDVGGDSRAAC